MASPQGAMVAPQHGGRGSAVTETVEGLTGPNWPSMKRRESAVLPQLESPMSTNFAPVDMSSVDGLVSASRGQGLGVARRQAV